MSGCDRCGKAPAEMPVTVAGRAHLVCRPCAQQIQRACRKQQHTLFCSAVKAGRRIRQRSHSGWRVPCRAYWCSTCASWHLTSMSKATA